MKESVLPSALLSIVFLAAAIIPAAVADEAHLNQFMVSRASFNGDTNTTAELAALILAYNSGEPSVTPSPSPTFVLPLPAAAFDLTGTRLEVQALHNDDQIHATAATFDGDRLEPPYEIHEVFRQASLVGTLVEEEYRLVVKANADATVTAKTECASLEFGNGTTEDASVSEVAPSSVIFEPCPGAEVWVDGDFTVELWQWDANLTSSEGTHRLDSGYTNRRTVFEEPTGSIRGTWISDDVVITIVVENGSLHFADYNPPGYARIFVDGCSVEGATEAMLEDANGGLRTPGRSAAISAGRLELTGELAFASPGRLAPGVDRMLIAFSGSLESASADGEPLTIGVVRSEGGKSWPGWWLVLFGAVLVPTTAALAWKISNRRIPGMEPSPAARRRAARYFETAQIFEIQGKPEKALDWVVRAIRNDALEPDYHALQAHALSTLGDYSGALRIHRRLHDMLPDEGDLDVKAWNAFEAAKCSQRQGNREDAISWLEAAVRYDSNVRDEIKLEPELLALVGEGRFLRCPHSRRPRRSHPDDQP